VEIDRVGFAQEDPRSCWDSEVRRDVHRGVLRGDYQAIVGCPPHLSWGPEATGGASSSRCRTWKRPWGSSSSRSPVGLISADENRILLWWAILCGEMEALERSWMFFGPAPSPSSTWSLWDTPELADLLNLGSYVDLPTAVQARGFPAAIRVISSDCQLEEVRSRSGLSTGTDWRHRVPPLCLSEDVSRDVAHRFMIHMTHTVSDVSVEEEKLPGIVRARVRRKESCRAPEVSEEWDPLSRWSEVFRVRWVKTEPSTAVECLTVVASVRHYTRAAWCRDQRLFFIVDNQATIGAFLKGRSSARRMLQLCRQLAGSTLSCGVRLVMRWISSKRNHADGPSRQRRLGYFDGKSG
jgi:hypothetical protein